MCNLVIDPIARCETRLIMRMAIMGMMMAMMILVMTITRIWIACETS